MTTSARILLPLAFAAFGLVLAAGPAPRMARAADEKPADEVAAALKEIDDAEKAAADKHWNKILAKIIELQDNRDKRITDKLVDLAKWSKNDRVAIAAMRQAAARKEKEKLFPWLKKTIDDKKYAEEHPERYLAALECLADYRDKSVIDKLAEVIDKFFATKQHPEYAVAAVKAYGSVREKPVIEQLLKWLDQCDTSRSGQGGGGGGGGRGGESQESRDAKAKVRDAAIAALKDLTGQDIGDAVTWGKWWGENAKTFKFPDPNAPKPTEIDPTGLTEWDDPAYGFKVKKPEGEQWKFQKPTDPATRLELKCFDATGMEMGRIDWRFHNTSTQKPKDIAGLAKWWTDEQLPKDMSEFSKGKEPKEEARKLGGVEWTIVTATGQGAEAKKAWGTINRRIYMTKLTKTPYIIMYVEAIFRTGMEPDDQAKGWACIEGTTLAPAEKN